MKRFLQLVMYVSFIYRKFEFQFKILTQQQLPNKNNINSDTSPTFVLSPSDISNQCRPTISDISTVFDFIISTKAIWRIYHHSFFDDFLLFSKAMYSCYATIPNFVYFFFIFVCFITITLDRPLLSINGRLQGPKSQEAFPEVAQESVRGGYGVALVEFLSDLEDNFVSGHLVERNLVPASSGNIQ